MLCDVRHLGRSNDQLSRSCSDHYKTSTQLFGSIKTKVPLQSLIYSSDWWYGTTCPRPSVNISLSLYWPVHTSGKNSWLNVQLHWTADNMIFCSSVHRLDISRPSDDIIGGVFIGVLVDQLRMCQPLASGWEIFDHITESIFHHEFFSTIIICESVGGHPLRALNASVQEKTYDKVLSKCLGTNVSFLVASFTSAPPTRSPISIWRSPTLRPTPRPTQTARPSWHPYSLPTPRPSLFIHHSKNCYHAVISIRWTCPLWILNLLCKYHYER